MDYTGEFINRLGKKKAGDKKQTIPNDEKTHKRKRSILRVLYTT